jgi:hypothetical protein
VVPSRSPRVAVLIDAENAPSAAAGRVLQDARSDGETAVRRVYGDFFKPCLAPWKAVILELGLAARQQCSNGRGKNAVDIALVVDAMDLLYVEEISHFCIMASDSDYTPLVLRLRERGARVRIFGEAKTPSTLRQACHGFTDLNQPATTHRKIAISSSNGVKPGHGTAAAILILETAFIACRSPNGWAECSRVGQQIRRDAPDLQWKDFGAKTLGELVEATGAFILRRVDGEPLRMRPKDGRTIS